ncbi:MAG TPA: hypothetical protein VMX77_02380 [Candidatus Bathyarchaeia archaeon]|nr:hypothetical protein [Candidatus Bathyarchaeia archaeon]
MGRPIVGGIEGKKMAAEATVWRNGRTKRAGECFIKESLPPYDDLYRSPAEILIKYIGLKAAGVPVVPTLRISEDQILMTDLSDGGENFIYSTDMYIDSTVKQRRLAFQLEPDNPELVRKKVHEAAEKAARAQYKLELDAYFLVVTPMGEVAVIVGDLGLGVAKVYDKDVEVMIRDNLGSASLFYKKAMKVLGIKDPPPLINQST